VRRSAFVLLAVVAIAIAVSAAYILRRNPPSPSPAVALVEQPSEPALAADLELSLSVNRGLLTPILRGWPVLVDVLIANPSADASVKLAPQSGTWPRAVRVNATGPSGDAERWPFELVAEPPSASMTLPAGASTHFFMILPEPATSSLPAGRHTISAELEIRGSAAWNGMVRATTWIEVQQDGSPSADQQLDVALLRARIYAMRNQHVEAAGVLEAHLATSPDAIPALQMMAEMLAESGDVGRAYLYTARALYVYGEAQAKAEPGETPPTELLLLRRRLWAKLVAATPAPGTLPSGAPIASPAAPSRTGTPPASSPTRRRSRPGK
jgi:hypothetical protein